MAAYHNVEDPMSMNTEIIPTENERGFFAKYKIPTLVFVATIIVGSAFAIVSNSGSYTKPVDTVVKEVYSSTAVSNEAPITFGDLTDAEKEELFEDFKITYERSYGGVKEASARYSNFLRFLSTIDVRNAKEQTIGGTGVHGITKFADFSNEELKALLGFSEKPSRPSIKNMVQYVHIDNDVVTTKETVDWFMIYTTEIKNQGYCGSCWAFSATEQIESDSIRAGYTTPDEMLSEQILISCDDACYGCDGGNPLYAYQHVHEAGGMPSNSTYPYTSFYGDSGSCVGDHKDNVVTVTEYYTFGGSNIEKSMETYVKTTGPLSVCLDASTWSSYTSGVISTCGTSVDHCVQITGYNTDENYWIVRNQWGTDWGLDGFIYVKAGENLCDITALPTFVAVEPADN